MPTSNQRVIHLYFKLKTPPHTALSQNKITDKKYQVPVKQNNISLKGTQVLSKDVLHKGSNIPKYLPLFLLPKTNKTFVKLSNHATYTIKHKIMAVTQT